MQHQRELYLYNAEINQSAGGTGVGFIPNRCKQLC